MLSLLSASNPGCSLFKQDAILRNCTSGHYWELSEEIITKIEASQTNREGYVSYMSDNPNVARRKFISMT